MKLIILIFQLIIPAIFAIPTTNQNDPSTSSAHRLPSLFSQMNLKSAPQAKTSKINAYRYGGKVSSNSNPVKEKEFAANVAQIFNTAIFKSNPQVADILKKNSVRQGQLARDPNKSKQLKENAFLTGKRYDALAVQISPDLKHVTVAMNVKQGKLTKKGVIVDKLGYQKDVHRKAIQNAIQSKIPQLKNARITIVGPKKTPQDQAKNAKHHAEMQIIKYNQNKPSRTHWSMGVNKPPCAKCTPQLKNSRTKAYGAGGKQLAWSKIKNWGHPNKMKIEVKDSFMANGQRESKSTPNSRRGSVASLSHRNTAANSRRKPTTSLHSSRNSASNSRRRSTHFHGGNKHTGLNTRRMSSSSIKGHSRRRQNSF